MHHLQKAGPLSDSKENLFFLYIPKSVLFSEISTLLVYK